VKPSVLLSDMNMEQDTPLSKPFSLMKVLSTAALPFENMHGLFWVNELCGNAFLSVGDGKYNRLFFRALTK
jgi:hypothetical protein